MAKPWGAWLKQLRSTTRGAWTHRQLAAAVDFTLRALEQRKATKDVAAVASIIDDVAWPPSLTAADRNTWRDTYPAIGVQTAAQAWLSQATSVLDDKGAALGDWTAYRDTADSLVELTARADVLRRGAQQAPPKAETPYRALVLGWPIKSWTNRAGVEAIAWMAYDVLGKSDLTADGWDVTVALAVTDAPEQTISTASASGLFGVLMNMADAADAQHVPMRPYVQHGNAWADAVAAAAADQADQVEPGVVNRDLPPVPPAPTSTPPPAATGKPGPYELAYQRFQVWARASNGSDGGDPRLTREQAAAVLRYIVGRVRAHLPATDPLQVQWLPIALALLGWRIRGDAYRTDEAWRKGWTPQPTLGELWAYALRAARAIDKVNAAFTGPSPKPTEDYAVMATEAAAAQKKDDPTMPPPTGATPPVPPVSPDDNLPPFAPTPPVPGGGAAAAGGEGGLLLLAFLLLSQT